MRDGHTAGERQRGVDFCFRCFHFVTAAREMHQHTTVGVKLRHRRVFAFLLCPYSVPVLFSIGALRIISVHRKGILSCLFSDALQVDYD